MTRWISLTAAAALFLLGCQRGPNLPPEAWVAGPAAQWPDLALTNEIVFADTTYHHLANAFLVDTGEDTLAVTSKHLFMLFEEHLGVRTVDLSGRLESWSVRSAGEDATSIPLGELINADPDETIGRFNTLKVRDWLLFEIAGPIGDIHPLKIRSRPVKKGERVFAVGRSLGDMDAPTPQVVELECYADMGPYFYVKTISQGTHPEGTSGSPVIDAKGHLVGIVSGAEGRLGVIGAVLYLEGLLEVHDLQPGTPDQRSSSTTSSGAWSEATGASSTRVSTTLQRAAGR